MQRAQVVKLDRGYPLVRCEDGRLVRCEHATALVKGEKVRAVIGDFVEVNAPEGHDKGIIESICPRERAFVRKDPTERAVPQVLGPASCVIERAKDRYRFHLLVKSPVGYHVSDDIDACLKEVGSVRGVSVSVDVDAYDLM